MVTKSLRLMCVFLFFAAMAMPLSFADEPSRDSEIRELKSQVRHLLQRIEQLEKQQGETEKNLAQKPAMTGKEADKSGVPEWIKEIKLQGDLRLRHQWEKRKGSNNLSGVNSFSRNRQRLRFRLGADTKVNDEIKLHFGIATDGGSGRSTNQTLDTTFDSKNIDWNYMYAQYKPVQFEWASLFGGKMKNPVWEPADLLWDTDINPEGLAAKLKWREKEKLSPYFYTGAFIIDENSAGSDPWMFVLQPGLKWMLSEKTTLNFANAFYLFRNVEGATLDNSTNNNSRVINGGGSFNSISPALELGIKKPLSILGCELPYLALFGEYIHNLNAKQSENGYLGGIRFGYDKVGKLGDWQMRYTYSLLQTYSWPDVFPDADRYSGRAGVRSNEVLFTYGLGKNWNVELDYYRNYLTNTNDSVENIVQADLNLKF